MAQAPFSELSIDAIFRDTRFGADADWVEHVPLIFWLFETLRPSTVADLSLDKGGLCMPVCEAALSITPCRVHVGRPPGRVVHPEWVDTLVDTLPTALIDRVTVHSGDISGFVTEIGSGSIDLLLTDAADDAQLEPLLPALSDRSVVVSHEPPLWGSPPGQRRTFEFTHAGGLWVSACGAEAPAVIEWLASLSGHDSYLVRAAFERLGASLRIAARLKESQRAQERLAKALEVLQSENTGLARERARLEGAVAAQMEASLANASEARRHEQLLKQVYRSPSWRLTKPLRVPTILRQRRADSAEGHLPDAIGSNGGEVSSRKREPGAPQAAAGDDPLAAEVRASGLVDEAWYRDRYPEVAHSGCDPVEHQLGYLGPQGLGWGGLSGQDPNPWFDGQWYRARYGDALAPGHTPLLDYLRADPREDRDTSFWFDSDWFRTTSIGQQLSAPKPALVQFCDAGWPRHMSFPGRLREEPRTRVVFVSGLPDHPGHRYRVEDVTAALPPHLYETAVLAITEWPDRRWVLSGTDLLWIWRAPMSGELREIIALARSQGARVVVDVDDLVFDDTLTAREIDGIRSQKLHVASQGELARRLFETMQNSDLVITPTASLADEAASSGLSAAVLPNGHDAAFAATSARARHRRAHIVGQPFRIGYAAGSRTHQRDLAVASCALATFLAQHHDARLVLFKGSIDLPELPDLETCPDQIEWRDPVPLEDLPNEYARFAVNIAPLEVGNRFCEAKSALKFNESAMVGVPTIASPTQPFRQVITSGVNGFLATSTEEWLAALQSVKADPLLRDSMGERAFQDVRWPFGPELRTLRASHIVQALLSGSPVEQSGGTADFGLRWAGRTEDSVAVRDDLVAADAGQVSIMLQGTLSDAVGCLEHLSEASAGALDLILLEREPSAGQDKQKGELAERLARLAIIAGTGDWRVHNFSVLAGQHVRTPWLLWLPPGAVLAPLGVKRLLQIAGATRMATVAPGLLAEETLRGVSVLSTGEVTDLALVSTALAARASGVVDDPDASVDVSLWRALTAALAPPD